jgi:acetylornithine deacetylase/succinyl-diaminopimelate desuccinylase-like protein
MFNRSRSGTSAGATQQPVLTSFRPAVPQLWPRNVQALGLMPLPLRKADEQGVHGDDERLPLASFHSGVEFLYRIVYEFAAAK